MKVLRWIGPWEYDYFVECSEEEAAGFIKGKWDFMKQHIPSFDGQKFCFLVSEKRKTYLYLPCGMPAMDMDLGPLLKECQWEMQYGEKLNTVHPGCYIPGPLVIPPLPEEPLGTNPDYRGLPPLPPVPPLTTEPIQRYRGLSPSEPPTEPLPPPWPQIPQEPEPYAIPRPQVSTGPTMPNDSEWKHIPIP